MVPWRRPPRRPPRDVPIREVPRELRETFREQWPTICGILLFAVVFFGVSIWLLPNGNVGAFLLNLSADMVGAVVIFIVLERGIRSINAINVIPDLPVGRFTDEVRTHSRIVRILETWTRLVNDEGTYRRFLEAVTEALHNGASVQVLLIHPASSAARQRAEQFSGRLDAIREMETTIRRFYAMRSIGRRLEVRLYNALPSITLYQVNRIAYVSLFPINQISSRHDMLEVEMFSRFGLFIEQSFNELWEGSDNSPTIPIDEFMGLSLDSGARAYFAFDVSDEVEDRRSGYIGGPLWDHLLLDGQVRERIGFQFDGARFQARLRVPSTVEIEVGRRLIQMRYEWDGSEGEVNLPIIARLEGIERMPTST